MPAARSRSAAPAPTFDQVAAEWHHQIYSERPIWWTTTWRGVQAQKIPSDLWVIGELIHRLKPNTVIEAGTAAGGSALFMADMLELNSIDGGVITIDLQPCGIKHPLINKIIGSSIDPTIVSAIRGIIGSGPVLVDLDSDHSKAHVLREMELYGPLVTPNSYMIVEDTNINGHPVYPEYGEGPHEAVEEFLANHPEFVADPNCEKYGVTFFPGGWLRRLP